MTATEALSDHYAREFPLDAARALETLDGTEIAELLCEFPPAAAARLLVSLSLGGATETLAALPPQIAPRLLDKLPRKGAFLLRRVPGDVQKRILDEMAGVEAKRMRSLLAYSDHCVGAAMDVDILTAPADASVGQAIATIRDYAGHKAHYLYATAADYRPIGVVTLMQLLTSERDTILADIMTRDPQTIGDRTPLTTAIAHTGWRQWRSLPVVDKDGRLVGLLRYDAAARDETATPNEQSSISLALSLAELFWLGATGLTKGLARVAPANAEDDDVSNADDGDKQVAQEVRS